MSAGEQSWIAETIKVFFDSTLQFYDKQPVVSCVGFLMLCGSLPLHMLLRYARDIKKLDNEKVLARYEMELQRARDKTSSQIGD